MKLAKTIAFIGLAAMTGVILRGFLVGNFNAEGNQLLAMPWGMVSLVDLYVGFTLFSGWNNPIDETHTISVLGRRGVSGSGVRRCPTGRKRGETERSDSECFDE